MSSIKVDFGIVSSNRNLGLTKALPCHSDVDARYSLIAKRPLSTRLLASSRTALIPYEGSARERDPTTYIWSSRAHHEMV